METRSDWHGVYIDLDAFAEYAANNPSSAYDLYLGIWKRQRLRGSASQVVVRSTYAGFQSSGTIGIFFMAANQEWRCF